MREHVGGALAPWQPWRALRELVPHHSGPSVLVPEDEFEFLAGPFKLSFAHPGIDSDQAVAGKKPGILRPAPRSRRTKAGQCTATQPAVAGPGLVQCDP